MSGVKCCNCGRFTPWSSDFSAPFDMMALEPPDDEFYCAKCAKELEDYYVEQGWVPNDWIKADWQRRAAKRLGLVEHQRAGNAWSEWKNPEKQLKGDV